MEEAESRENSKDTMGDNNVLDNSALSFLTSREKELQQQVNQLEEEKRKIYNEFNAQRAKLKELFIQKESEHLKCQRELEVLGRELDEMKSQFVVADLKQENELQLKESKAREEIQSLQQLVQDTIEESTASKSELEYLKKEFQRIWHENNELRETLQNSQQESLSTSLAPQMLNQVKKSIARKLGGDTNATSLSESTDGNKNSSGSMQSLVQEDSEVLRSIVEQLQEEMSALKHKLREADVQLQAKQVNSSNKLVGEPSLTAGTILSITTPAAEGGEVISKSNCENCKLLETKLEQLLNESNEHEEQINLMRKNVDEAKDALEKEAAMRKDLEHQWQEKREAHKTEVQLLRDQVRKHEHQLLELQHKFHEAKEEVTRKLHTLITDRERVNKQLETLQADNDFLSGGYLATAEEIENQCINLPDTVEELQELMLRQRDELIQARVGSAYEKRRCLSTLDEIQILRDQLDASNAERQIIKNQLQSEIKTLQHRLTQHLLTLQNYESTKTGLERKEAELNRQISQLRVDIIELRDINEKLTKINADYKAKLKNHQEELAMAELVQKDFVKLSQSLQVSLEKLRNADSEVRWQDDEDISSCPKCQIYFTVTLRKTHCRHCGQIFCEKCLTKDVPSGPRKRPARVCDVCHTLLTPNTAPYFSEEPLKSK